MFICISSRWGLCSGNSQLCWRRGTEGRFRSLDFSWGSPAPEGSSVQRLGVSTNIPEKGMRPVSHEAVLSRPAKWLRMRMWTERSLPASCSTASLLWGSTKSDKLWKSWSDSKIGAEIWALFKAVLRKRTYTAPFSSTYFLQNQIVILKNLLKAAKKPIKTPTQAKFLPKMFYSRVWGQIKTQQ